MAEGKKRGPKTDNPKLYRISVKVDNKGKDILERYCKKNAVTQAEAVRRGIYHLESELEK